MGQAFRVLAALLLLLAVAGCEQLFQQDSERAISAGDKKSAAGDYRFAIKLYEAALDGTAKTAEVHYKLAMIYDDKLNDPVSALHHFARYFELAPTGAHAKEARNLQKANNLRVAESLNKGAFVTQEEAVRIKKENLDLRLQIVALKAQKAAPPSSTTPGVKSEAVQRPLKPGVRTYTVQSGDTLGLIAAKFYKNKGRWKMLQDTNFFPSSSTPTLKPGQVLMVP